MFQNSHIFANTEERSLEAGLAGTISALRPIVSRLSGWGVTAGQGCYGIKMARLKYAGMANMLNRQAELN